MKSIKSMFSFSKLFGSKSAKKTKSVKKTFKRRPKGKKSRRKNMRGG